MRELQDGRKRRKRRLIRNLMIALVSVIMVLLGVVGYLYFNGAPKTYDLQAAYVPGTSGNGVRTTDVTNEADPFAAELVVSDDNVDLANVNFQSPDERGLLFNLETKEACFARGAYDRVYPASITKLMTAILAIKYGDMDLRVKMTPADLELGSDSQMSGLVAGDTVTVRQLFSVLLVYSANDAAMALARTIGGDVEGFVQMMNAEAQALGMSGTHFTNPHGLHNPDHYTTPYDVYLMLDEAAKYSEITDTMKNAIYKLEITSDDGSYRAYNLDTTDQYLSGEHPLPAGVTIMAGKTGTTNAAGNCLALAVQNSYGVPYISIVMNAPNKSILYADMDALLSETNQTL